MFWSRGNGWVMAGIVRTLPFLPQDDPARAKYISQLKEMAARVAELQNPDGLWRAGLLDPDAYDLPEMSGSAFITYALAAGVNQGLLSKKVYKPVIAKAWAGMLHHVYADGRLGCIQQTGERTQALHGLFKLHLRRGRISAGRQRDPRDALIETRRPAQ